MVSRLYTRKLSQQAQSFLFMEITHWRVNHVMNTQNSWIIFKFCQFLITSPCDSIFHIYSDSLL
jgi:hypothetical protein